VSAFGKVVLHCALLALGPLIGLYVALSIALASGFESDALIGKLGVHRTVFEDTLLDIALR
jgi:hypothetical protein